MKPYDSIYKVRTCAFGYHSRWRHIYMGDNHAGFGHEIFLCQNGNDFNTIKIYDSLYRVYACAFGYHDMWLEILGRHGHWIESNHKPDVIGTFRSMWALDQVIPYM